MRSGDRGAPNLLEQMGYETRDITLPRIFFWIGVLFAFAFGSMGVVWILYIVFIPNYAKLGQPSPVPANRRIPPHPQLQVEPRRDMVLYRVAEDRALNPEGVEEAMNTIANERGIAGVRGNAVKGRGDSYPGSGNYVTPDGAETGNTNVLESSHDPQVGEKPLPGGAEREPGEHSQTPAAGGGVPPSAEPEPVRDGGEQRPSAVPSPEATTAPE